MPTLINIICINKTPIQSSLVHRRFYSLIFWWKKSWFFWLDLTTTRQLLIFKCSRRVCCCWLHYHIYGMRHSSRSDCLFFVTTETFFSFSFLVQLWIGMGSRAVWQKIEEWGTFSDRLLRTTSSSEYIPHLGTFVWLISLLWMITGGWVDNFDVLPARRKKREELVKVSTCQQEAGGWCQQPALRLFLPHFKPTQP